MKKTENTKERRRYNNNNNNIHNKQKRKIIPKCNIQRIFTIDEESKMDLTTYKLESIESRYYSMIFSPFSKITSMKSFRLDRNTEKLEGNKAKQICRKNPRIPAR